MAKFPFESYVKITLHHVKYQLTHTDLREVCENICDVKRHFTGYYSTRQRFLSYAGTFHLERHTVPGSSS